jgi:acetylornithine deacetylase
MTESIRFLDTLIAFPTVSRDSNLALIGYVEQVLGDCGAETRRIASEDGRKANLYAVLGPAGVPGVMLSGHTDVVPVDGQEWSGDPFRLRRRDGRLYGRGSADMKGFIACVLALARCAAGRTLTTPLVIALSYDEEVGCLGVRRMLDMMEGLPVRPRCCIIGEPTEMQVVTAHKGKAALRVECSGVACHSSLAPNGLNAVHLAADMIAGLRQLQDQIARSGRRDGDYEIPYTTIHVGRIEGGTALNIVPNACSLDMEIRHLPQDDIDDLLRAVGSVGARVADAARARFPQADVALHPVSSYPALDTPPDSEVVSFVRGLTGSNSLGKMSFGTEGGLYQKQLAVPTVVCGPGSIAQAHKPDEYIAEDQLAQCDQAFQRLLAALEA